MPQLTPVPPPAVLDQLVVLFNAGQHAELENRARSLLGQYPDSGFIWKALGISLQTQGKDGLAALQHAVELLPDDAAAHNNLGAILEEIGRLDDALACFQHALELRPNYAEALSNMGMALRGSGRLGEAEANLRRALELKPDFAAAHSNLGNVLKDQGRLIEAEACYRRSLELKPGGTETRNNLLFVLNYSASHTPTERLDEARQYGQMVTGKVTAQFSDWRCADRPERLRVGLVSGDLLNHPVGYFLEGLLKKINPDRIELIAYPTNGKADKLTARIKPYFSAWKPLIGLSDEAAAGSIHADGVHLLVDLSGHVGYNRLPVFAWKPAPVLVSWLGYFATTGLAEMDYLLADEVGVPEANRAHFTEEIWCLPDTRLCFTPPDVDLPVADLPAFRKGYLTFGCFQALEKVSDEVLAAWANILNKLPDARLRWQGKQLSDPAMVKQLERRLRQQGIDHLRVEILGPVLREDYLAAHSEVDILLDTFPYPGGTTTCEALWMGVPTLTLAGDTLLARQGASLIAAAGLEDWIATSVTDYVDKAIALSTDLIGLSALRSRLREQVSVTPLFDASRFASNMEAALWGMWQAKVPDTMALNQRGNVMKPSKAAGSVKTFLHVGCGSKRKQQTTRAFNNGEWNELRLDIDENVNPDFVGSMTDMSSVQDASMDAVYSSHNIEHLYPHDVPTALKEFLRVLKPDGFLVLTCPDLQSVCALIADDKLTEPAFTSPAGPIAPIDILYGHRPSLAHGNLYMAHRCGFTQRVLTATLQANGFAMVAAARRAAPYYDLWAVASKAAMEEDVLRQLAVQNFPG